MADDSYSYGAKNLRVCDVSTFGRLPDVNLVGSVYMVAEMGADIIRKDYNDECKEE
jgi:choline dehydrogenase